MRLVVVLVVAVFAPTAVLVTSAQAQIRSKPDPVGDDHDGSRYADITNVSVNFGAKRIVIRVDVPGLSRTGAVGAEIRAAHGASTAPKHRVIRINRTHHGLKPGYFLENSDTGDQQPIAGCPVKAKWVPHAQGGYVTASMPSHCAKPKVISLFYYARVHAAEDHAVIGNVRRG